MKLSKEQVTLLKLSEKDIKKGKLISHSKLDKKDLKWLKEFGMSPSTHRKTLIIIKTIKQIFTLVTKPAK